MIKLNQEKVKTFKQNIFKIFKTFSGLCVFGTQPAVEPDIKWANYLRE